MEGSFFYAVDLGENLWHNWREQMYIGDSSGH